MKVGEAVNVVGILIVAILAPLPIIEMRAAIALGILRYDLGWPLTFAITAAVNIAAIPLIWAGLPLLEGVARRNARVSRFLDRMYAKTRKEAGKGKEVLEEVGILTIVSLTGLPIPVPGSGLYTAVIGAYVFGLPFRKMFLWASVGVLIACAAITVLVLVGQNVAHGW